MITSSVKNKNSRYVWGGTTDTYINRLGWWERYKFRQSDGDVTLKITPEYDRRPDLLAFDLYGKDYLACLILQYNAILDINTEFVTGVEIRVPSRSRVDYDILNKQVGGTPVTK